MIERKKSKWFVKSTRQDRISFLMVFAIITLIFGTSYLIQQGFVSFGPIEGCAFERNYGLPCPTCGFTRAAGAFMQGRILTAVYIQPAAAAGFTVLLWTAFFSLLSAALGVNFSFLPPVRIWQLKYLLGTAFFILAAGWAVTLARTLAKIP